VYVTVVTLVFSDVYGTIGSP